jgi:hypothetical protein
MKTNLLKYYIAAFYFCSTYLMSAQPGDTAPGGLEEDGDTTPGAPIDDYVWVLAVIGLLFVFLKFRAIYKQGTRTKA